MDSGEALVWLGVALATAVAMAFLGRYVSTAKGRGPREGFWLGLLFGCFGVLLAALLPARAERVVAEMEPKTEPVPDPSPPADYQWQGSTVHWTCECGKPRQADERLGGKVAPCPVCKTRTLIPLKPQGGAASRGMRLPPRSG